jgi:hypothetical protein
MVNRLKFEIRKGITSEDPIWYVWEVDFDSGEIKRITHSYWVYLSGNSIGEIYFEYKLKTGATWKGEIDSADIKIHFPPWTPRALGESVEPLPFIDHNKFDWKGFASIRPDGYKLEDRTIHWILKDFEPDENIFFHYDPILKIKLEILEKKPPGFDTVEAYYEVGGRYSFAGNIKEAIKWFERATNKFPEHCNYYGTLVALSQCYLKTGDTTKALTYLKRVWNDREYLENRTLLRLAFTFKNAGEIDKAKDTFKWIIENSNSKTTVEIAKERLEELLKE